jgi:L-alanine-DL-glutamate epimerase-like enolase superfamily enzyme
MQAGTSISSIEIYKLFIPLKEPFLISLGPIPNAENIIIIIKTQNGAIGYGECSPFMIINGESADTCLVVAQYLAKVLLGQDALHIEKCMQIMDKTIYGNSSIKSAFDIALYDIAAQIAELPLYKYLGGKKDKVLFTDMTVSIDHPQKMKDDAIKFKAQAFPAIKVKLGEKENDIERIKAIREGIGNEIPLRIDANQGWPNADEAIKILKELAFFNIEHCEEPIPRWQFMDLKKVSDASPIPIMADETCGNHHDAERLIKLNACHMINIKLGKSSGIFNALKIIDIAAKANIPLQIGGFIESRLGMTAAAHLALTSEYVHYCDFDTPLMFTEDPIKGGIKYLEKGIIEVPEAPGLGAVVDELFLKEAEKKVIFNKKVFPGA